MNLSIPVVPLSMKRSGLFNRMVDIKLARSLDMINKYEIPVRRAIPPTRNLNQCNSPLANELPFRIVFELNMIERKLSVPCCFVVVLVLYYVVMV